MSATKHTPGPWRPESESRSPDGSDLLVTTADGAYSIADCRMQCTGVGSVDEAEANARLIAAAPDLLAELRALVEGIERAAAAGVDLSGYVGTGRALALIARVEGRR